MANETFIEGSPRGRAPETFIEHGQDGYADYQPLPPSLVADGYRVVRELGVGAEARVWLCTNGGGLHVAVKVYFRAPTYAFEFDSPEYRRHFFREWTVEVLQRGSDRVAGTEIHFEVMEYCAGGTLEDFIATEGGTDETAIRVLARLTHCLKNLQGPQARIVHGDVKPRNVLVRDAASVDLVLSDFGLTINLGERSNLSNFGQGTTAYNAPEIMRIKGAPADWWSLGMVMYTVLVGRGYYQVGDGHWLNQRAIEADLISRDVSLTEVDGLVIPSERRARWKLLLAGLLTRDPDLRWGAAQVEAWLAGKAPAVHRPLDGRGEVLPDGIDGQKCVEPFAFAGVGEFTTAAALGAAMSERQSEAARMLSGKGTARLITWLTEEFHTADDYSEVAQNNWDPDARVTYFIARLAPDAPLTFRGQSVAVPTDLIRMAQSGDTDVVGALFDAELLGSLADDGMRATYRMIDVNWHDLVGRASDLAAQRGIIFTDDMRRFVRQVALLVVTTAGSGTQQKYADDVVARVSGPDYAPAREMDWFVRLVVDAGRGHGASNAELALALLLDACAESALERGQQIQEDRAEEVRRRARSAASDATTYDVMAVMFAGLLAVTVLVPFLIGHFLMTKTFVLKPDPRVYEDVVRGISDHFWATYLGGLLPIVLLMGLFLVLRRPWEYRRVSVVGGAVALIGTLAFLLPLAQSQWRDAERTTIAKLRETAFPFDDRYYNCESWDFDAENGSHDAELWQVHLGRLKGTNPDGCNRVNVYRGWQFVGAYNLPDGDTFTGEIVVNAVSWTEPVRATSSRSFSQHSTKTGLRTPMNPIATNINLLTENGHVLDFSLDGAGNNGFTLR
ncbi:hypothetical protein A5740_02980 [Mycobacterium sp. GA-1841]|uniref:serine/threonine protein kinase n=1 Tax=Mycobacterium sp. GA-1841 TaxID=1834154 RepID=UPI00096C0793|nr:protein kinase [Mycobacterium sp. GA-1841]OMC39019.1 hypothetical protein A5740_02980 [Mycobacterium sp. GA-1841]